MLASACFSSISSAITLERYCSSNSFCFAFNFPTSPSEMGIYVPENIKMMVKKKTVISFGRHKYGAWNCVLGLILSVDDMIINVLHSLHGWRTVLQRIRTAMPRPTRRICTLRSTRCTTFSAALATTCGATA